MKYIVDIKGEIEGDYEIIGKYEERPQGEWMWIAKSTNPQIEPNCIKCSICNFYFNNVTRFCPNCGAQMVWG